ncbi:MAG: ATP-binding protein [Candidatus Hodarchaeota archaeon]
MNTLIRVLLVEDNPGDARLIREMLVNSANSVHFEMVLVENLDESIKCLKKEKFDVILLDLNLPDSKDLDTFIKLNAKAPDLPIVMLTGINDEIRAFKAVKNGAQDYLVKGEVDSNLLTRSIRYAIERKKAEETIKKYAKDLEESNRLKDLFSDIMSHDLLNPIAVSETYLEFLLEDEIVPKRREDLLTIQKCLFKARELINSTAKLSKLGEFEKIELSNLDLKQILEDVISNITPLLEGMTIENKITERIPIKANKIIEDVFSNLISNAIKYGSEGKQIILEAEEGDNFWRIKVKDFGPGIEDKYKETIFERFTRRAKGGVRGTGIGLTIAKRIVLLHKGKIWAEDNPEGGAIFVVEIPKPEREEDNNDI